MDADVDVCPTARVVVAVSLGSGSMPSYLGGGDVAATAADLAPVSALVDQFSG